jgi:hypothetical protein
VNAQVNSVMGMGYELNSIYTGCSLEFQNIGNIHVMRDSLKKLFKFPNDPSAVDGWLDHIKKVCCDPSPSSLPLSVD